MIKGNEEHFSVGMMCRLLSVLHSGYYSWKNRPLSGRDQANQKLVTEIKRIFDDENGRPGSPRISRRLQEEDKSVSRHRVAKLMKDNGLRAKAAKKYKAANSNHSLPVAPNLLEQNFTADASDQKWVSDITYIWTDEGWLYLAVVLELYSRRVIAWAIGTDGRCFGLQHEQERRLLR
ncbi:MAG: IS3 family transposase [Methylobacter sp.]